MSISLSSPVGGKPQVNLTGPTFTVVPDTAPDSNGKQYAITALGGTQAGVSVHSVASPFTFTFWRPKILRTLGNPNVNTNVISNVPMNTYKAITRKGVIPLAGQPSKTMVITTTIDVPAGSDSADAEDIRSALSFHFGALDQLSSGIGDTVVNGVL